MDLGPGFDELEKVIKDCDLVIRWDLRYYLCLSQINAASSCSSPSLLSQIYKSPWCIHSMILILSLQWLKKAIQRHHYRTVMSILRTGRTMLLIALPGTVSTGTANLDTRNEEATQRRAICWVKAVLAPDNQSVFPHLHCSRCFLCLMINQCFPILTVADVFCLMITQHSPAFTVANVFTVWQSVSGPMSWL